MKIKKYEVTDMREALKLIKDELGSDAVILTTRKIMKPAGLGLFPKQMIEVTAATNYDKELLKKQRDESLGISKPSVTAPSEPTPMELLEEPAIKTPVWPSVYPEIGAGVKSASSLNLPLDLPADDDESITGAGGEKDEEFLQRLFGKDEASDLGAISDLSKGLVDDTYAKPAAPQLFERQEKEYFSEEDLMPEAPMEAAIKPVEILPTSAAQADLNELKELVNVLKTLDISTITKDINQIKDHLAQVQQFIEEPANINVDLPKELSEIYNTLTKNGVEDIVAYRFLKGIQEFLPKGIGKAHLKELVGDKLAQIIPCEDNYLSVLNKKIVAFIGPTGVGKTTTIAKIAAELVLRYTQTVCLITTDNFRIGAVEQLKTYAEIVELPMYVATNPEELASLLNDIASEFDYILLDSTGRSPYDDSRDDIAAYLNVFEGIMPVLVLSMAGNHGELSHMYEKYAKLAPEYIIFTKLDETIQFGPLVNIPVRKNIKLLLLSVGQNVPEDLEIPNGKKIARKLLQEMPELWKKD